MAPSLATLSIISSEFDFRDADTIQLLGGGGADVRQPENTNAEIIPVRMHPSL
jgi:hypothetical protein